MPKSSMPMYLYSSDQHNTTEKKNQPTKKKATEADLFDLTVETDDLSRPYKCDVTHGTPTHQEQARSTKKDVTRMCMGKH
jgi:hypothetical protein